MSIKKQYQCEIPDCGRLLVIRSTIKTGEFKGKKACPQCKQKIEGKKPKKNYIKKYTQKGLDKRKSERAGLPEFFDTAIEELKRKPFCQNCNCSINVSLLPHNNIAHLLSKQRYKSVMTNPYNRVFLCDTKDHPIDNPRSCHAKFDSSIYGRSEMEVFTVALILYGMFKDDVLEQGKEREIFENGLY